MNFTSALHRIRRWHCLGRLAIVLFLVAALGALSAFLIGLADYHFAFEGETRHGLRTLWITLLIFTSLAGIIAAFHFSIERTSQLADRLINSPRDPASAALDLPDGDTPLSHFLTERTREESTSCLASIPASRMLPLRSLTRSLSLTLICLLPIAVAFLSNRNASSTVSQRLLDPSEDLPPWSDLSFTLEPDPLEAVYGGDLLVRARIDGDLENQAVECLLRNPTTGEILRLPAFRESENIHSRTLEALTENLEVAFACGRARSTWKSVDLLLQPKVTGGEIAITPPVYTGLDARSSPLDTNELSAITASKVELTIRSNRPVGPSDLTLTPASQPGRETAPLTVAGEIADTYAITFSWIADLSGTLSITLHDVRGTPASSPFEIAFRTKPDKPPAVDLSSPPPLLLATPSSQVPLRGRAEDDHQLSRVQFVRTLTGFRDRAIDVAPQLEARSYDFDEMMNLAEIGVEPGQTLELYLEAADHNPSLLGQGASEISRIFVISEEDYAARIRATTTIEQFSARYSELERLWNQAKESLDKLREAALKRDKPVYEEATKASQAAHQEAREFLDKLVDDFPAFDLEERLQEAARDASSAIKENQRDLLKLDPDDPLNKKLFDIQDMIDRLSAPQEQLDELQEDAEDIADASAILEMAARFSAIYESQKSLVKRFFTIAQALREGEDRNRRQLPLLAETQTRNREALDNFAAELAKRCKENDENELADLRDGALAFLEELKKSEPGSLMDLAAEAGRNGSAHEASVQAERARVQLERLMNLPDNPFAEATKGNAPEFPDLPPDANDTLAQLLQSLMQQNRPEGPNQRQGEDGEGQQPANGRGDGDGQGGFAMRNAPLLGPNRMQFRSNTPGGSGPGKGQSGRPAPSEAAESETHESSEPKRETRASVSIETIPAPYREAVKRYFSDNQPTP